MSTHPSRVASLQDSEAGLAVIPDDAFASFVEYFYRRTGIIFAPSKRSFVERRLVARMQNRNAVSVRSYLALLRFNDPDSAEFQSLVNALTINETHFNREGYQFECLVSSILPELIAERQTATNTPIRIWSLPCSTGEEPYSLAIHLLEKLRDVDRHNVEIVGSDIDTDVIAHARAGYYDERSMRFLSEAVRNRYFERVSAGTWQVNATLKASVDLGLANISDPADMRRYRMSFDVIFCRNLLIYFDDASRRAAVEALYDALRPGGFVCLGHSESMSRISSLFTIRKFPHAIVYQRPLS